MDLNGGPKAILRDIFNFSDLPFMLVVGVNVVVLFEFFVEVVVFELSTVLPQHEINIYFVTLQKI